MRRRDVGEIPATWTEPRSPSDKAMPAEAVEGRDRLGEGVGRIWIGVLVVAAILLAIVVYLVA